MGVWGARVGVGPGPSGGQDQVPGKLGTREVLRYLTFSWVGLCTSTRDVLGLMCPIIDADKLISRVGS